jgi:hypothetical protein
MKLDDDIGEALYARKLAENEMAGTRIVCDEICVMRNARSWITLTVSWNTFV